MEASAHQNMLTCVLTHRMLVYMQTSYQVEDVGIQIIRKDVEAYGRQRDEMHKLDAERIYLLPTFRRAVLLLRNASGMFTATRFMQQAISTTLQNNSVRT